MAKPKIDSYEEKIKPYLAEIEKWFNEGMMLKGIHARLGVNSKTFGAARRNHPELATICDNAIKAPVRNVEKALYRNAIGYTHVEIIETLDKKAGKLVISKKTTKQYPPQVSAEIFYLKNRDPEHWQDVVKHESERKLKTLAAKLEAAQKRKRERVPAADKKQPVAGIHKLVAVQ